MIQKPELNKNPIQIKRALVSVYDKTNVVDLVKVLYENKIEILSTGAQQLN